MPSHPRDLGRGPSAHLWKSDDLTLYSLRLLRDFSLSLRAVGDTHPARLRPSAQSYYDSRAATHGGEHNEGMTKTYNRFHDIYETGSRIVELRDLHTAMDRAVT